MIRGQRSIQNFRFDSNTSAAAIETSASCYSNPLRYYYCVPVLLLRSRRHQARTRTRQNCPIPVELQIPAC